MNGYRAQSGAVLLIALIMLLVMTLGSLALMRSVVTTTMVAGNLSFQQSATYSGDIGVETGIRWVENNSGLLFANQPGAAYSANGLTSAPDRNANESWDSYWTRIWNARALSLPLDAATGNTVNYVIDRLCLNVGSPTGGANCATSPVITKASGNSEEANEIQVDAPSLVYYRITARIQGPRNTLSYVQAVIAR